MDLLPLELVGELDLAAASGVRRSADRLYVVADDELALGIYDLEGRTLGRIALLPGALSDEPRERKAHKPDFEALISLPGGALLALGSGSTPGRRHAVTIECGGATRKTQVRVFAFDTLYTALERELPELNLEGGAVLGDRMWLCSRGNSVRRDDALIELDLERVLGALTAGRAPDARAISSVQRVRLTALDGAPLSITDLTVLAGELVFTAAAEASPNTYDDGVTTGSVIGRLSTAGVPECWGMVSGLKLEGLCPTSEAPDETEVFLVADADDRSSRAPLYRAQLRSFFRRPE